jgi:hypothetical protein
MDASLSFGPSMSMDDDDCVLTAVRVPPTSLLDERCPKPEPPVVVCETRLGSSNR